MRSVGCVLGAAIAFGTVSVLARRAYEVGSTPVSLLGVRMLVAALMLTGLAMGGSSWRVHPGELAAGAAAGMAFAAAGLGEFEALARAPAPTVVVLVFVAPVWIALVAWAAGQGAPGWLPASSIALILVGLALVVGVPGGRAADGAAVGLALGASVMSAAFFIAMGRLSGRVRPWPAACMTAWAASITTVLLEPTGFSRELSHRATGSYGLAIGALTACGLALLATGLQGNSALWASAVIGVEPLVAAGLAWPILGETLSATQLAGAAGVLLGVTAISLLSGREPPATAATDRTRRRPPGSRPPPRPARNARRRQ
jgi:drug/metabolite transporter (DMT)-like permease